MNIKRLSQVIFIVAAGFAASCIATAAKPGSADSEFPDLIRVPLTRQSTHYTCGVAALQSVFGYYGDDFRESELARRLKAGPRHGTRYQHIAKVAAEAGYSVKIYKDLPLYALRKLLKDGTPVICLIQAWSEMPTDYKTDWKDGHYVVAIGATDDRVYFMDPSTLGHYTFIPCDDFLDRWHDTDGKERLHHFAMTVTSKKPPFNPFEVKLLE